MTYIFYQPFKLFRSLEPVNVGKHQTIFLLTKMYITRFKRDEILYQKVLFSNSHKQCLFSQFLINLTNQQKKTAVHGSF